MAYHSYYGTIDPFGIGDDDYVGGGSGGVGYVMIVITTATPVSEQILTVRYAWRKSSVKTAFRRESRVHFTQLDVYRG